MKTSKELIVRRVAGTVVLVTLALSYWVNPGWLWVTAFVGANLLQSSFTGFCPLTVILDKLHVGSETGKTA